MARRAMWIALYSAHKIFHHSCLIKDSDRISGDRKLMFGITY